MTNSQIIDALRETAHVLARYVNLHKAGLVETHDESTLLQEAIAAIEFVNTTLITQLEQAETQRQEVDLEAMDKAIQIGVQQFEQQMQLGGGSLSEMFTRVIRAYLDAAAITQLEVETQRQVVDVEVGARAMHEAYEAAARVHGWATNERCKTDFDSLPDANRLTMLDAVAACATAWNLTPSKRDGGVG